MNELIGVVDKIRYTWRDVNVYYLSVKGSVKFGVNFMRHVSQH